MSNILAKVLYSFNTDIFMTKGKRRTHVYVSKLFNVIFLIAINKK